MAARAALAGTRAEAANQQQRLDVAIELIERQFVSKRELDARTNDRDAAKASVARASAQLDILENGSRPSDVAAADARARAAASEASVARASADQCILRSPISGKVLQILRHEGEFSGASRGEPLIVVGDISNLVARAEIGERDAALVKEGQAAHVWIEGQPSRWKGHVVTAAQVMGRRSARSLDPTDRFDRDVREVFIAFDGEEPPALVGLRVTVGLLR